MLALLYVYQGDAAMVYRVSCAVYMVTAFVYGSVISLMPILCSKVFGPSTNANVTLLLNEQQSYMQRIQLAINLYERWIFRVGTLMAIALATLLTFFLRDEELVWSYSGLLVGSAYAIAAFSSFKRFTPDIMTGVFAQGVSEGMTG